ncbi:YwaF family protein [Bacillus sp. FJAT-45350]|uniref:YwaF family protein n=1 Tax=Bacillus sp. FJAT-45350 TaxID=2011014 RepID=UPI000BB8BE4E|nr:TIGR02206 family membrane protein [Bacillus sp. FJAT-45350]
MAEFITREAFIDEHLFFSKVHISTVLIFLLSVWAFYLWRNTKSIKIYGRIVILLLLIVSEISIHLWSYYVGVWNLAYHLPLQLCTISLYLCIGMLLTRIKIIFEFVYFFGLAGAFLAILTPELFYTFPHFRFFHFFIAHFAIIYAVLYMVWVEKMRITFYSLIKSFLFLNGVALTAYIANQITGANYMYLAQKPTSPTVLDYLGPYPWYILSLQIVAFTLFLLLYIPFKVRNKRVAK